MSKKTQLKDSLFNIKSKEIIANLEANEVIQHKDKVIKVKEIKLEEAERKNFYMIIAFMFVITSGIIIFYRYKLNQTQ